MDKLTDTKDIEKLKAEQERLRGIFRDMLNRKREDQRTAAERHANDPEFQKALEELRKENAERGTPIIGIQL